MLKKINQSLSTKKIHKNLNIPFLKTKTKDLLERGFENFKEKKNLNHLIGRKKITILP